VGQRVRQIAAFRAAVLRVIRGIGFEVLGDAVHDNGVTARPRCN
jgi:hypothetical protein